MLESMICTTGWIGAVLGIIGAAWIACCISSSKYGFVAFLGSNIALMMNAMLTLQPALLFMQAMFFVVNMVAIVRWFMMSAKTSRQVARDHSLTHDHDLPIPCE
jgi:urea transporter